MNRRWVFGAAIVLLLAAIGADPAQSQDRDQWVSLFDGKTLSGWSVHSLSLIHI